MLSIFKKNSWVDVDWDVYFNNLDTLRKRKGMSKGKFNDFLGVWNAYRRRGLNKPGRETVLTVCQKFNVTEEWLGAEHPEETAQSVSQPAPPYDPHGGWKPSITIEQFVGIPRGLGMGSAIDLLASIYASRDETLIRAVYSNLRAFAQVVGEREKRSQLESMLETLQDETVRLKKEVAELKSVLQAQVQAATYVGPERRSGIERRQHQADRINGIERRSGVDRRKTPVSNNGSHQKQ
jgi:transcriptional regulator with XRE-family HTH domain